ncbi:hypothetical protein PTKIN_Ptkin13bG0230300 [Pterospermum kingtungense]
MVKLSRNLTIAFFSVFLAALMMCGEVAVGQEICHDVLEAPGQGICDPQSCKDQCASKYGASASGLCFQYYQNLHSCNCSWPCRKH